MPPPPESTGLSDVPPLMRGDSESPRAFQHGQLSPQGKAGPASSHSPTRSANASPRSTASGSPSKAKNKDDGDDEEKSWMRFLPSITTLELLVAYVQYIGLLLGVQVGWPSEYTDSNEIINFTVLDVRNKVWYIPPLDYRMYFLALATVLPLLLTFLMLVFFKTFDVVVWYFILLSGIAALSAAVALKLLPGNVFTQDKPSDVFLYAGIASLSVCILAFIGKMLYLRHKRKKAQASLESNTEVGGGSRVFKTISTNSNVGGSTSRTVVEESLLLDSETKRKYEARPMWQLFLEAAILAFLLVCFLLCVFMFEIEDSELITVTGPARTAGLVLGRTCAVFFVFGTIHLLLLQTRKGRIFLQNMTDFVRANTVRVMILILMVLYIPVTNTLLATGNCQEMTCPVGTRFPDKDVRLDSSAMDSFRAVDLLDICQRCDFIGTCNKAGDLCPATTDGRLLVDPSLSCERHIFPYYTPAASLILIGFTLGVPLLFYTLIRHATGALLELEWSHCGGDSQFNSVASGVAGGAGDKEQKKKASEEVETRYARVTGITDNSAKTLYYAFEFSWRYFKIFLLIQRLVIVGLALYLTRHPKASVISMTAVHFLFTAQSLWSRPYLSDNEDLLSSMMSLCLVFDGTVGIMLAYGYTPEKWLVYTLPAINVILPLAGTLVGSLLISRRKKMLRQLALSHDALDRVDETGTDIRGRLMLHQLMALADYRREKVAYENRMDRLRAKLRAGRAPASLRRGSTGGVVGNSGINSLRKSSPLAVQEERGEGGAGGVKKQSRLRRTTIAVGRLPSSSEDESSSMSLHCDDGGRDIVSRGGRGPRAAASVASSSYEYETDSDDAEVAKAQAKKAESSASYYSTSSDEDDEMSKVKPFKPPTGSNQGASKSGLPPLAAPSKPVLLTDKAKALRSNSVSTVQANKARAVDEAFTDDDELGNDHLVKGVQRMDRLLNLYTAKAMANYFLVLGVLAFCALAIVLVGIVHGATTSTFISHGPRKSDFSQAYITSHEFADYGSWDEMVDNCCCEDGGATPKYPLTEEWTCLNGFIKQKARVATLKGDERLAYGGESIHSGLALRPLCGNETVAAICGPTYIPDRQPLRLEFNFYVVNYCDANQTMLNNQTMSEYALERLW